MITKPMLAGEVKDPKALSFPLIASPKLDGIRCLKLDGKVLSRSFKPIPNHHIRETLTSILPDNVDGEIMAGDTFQAVTSSVMSREGQPQFKYWMFDFVPDGDTEMPYVKRMMAMIEWWDEQPDDVKEIVVLVPGQVIHSYSMLMDFEERVLKEGYEGVMTRAPRGPYKCGRSTTSQEWLLKLKRFVDDEAVVIGFEEMMHNENELGVDELGYAKRSSSKDGKVPAGTLGKFRVKHKTFPDFSIGTGQGLTQELRQEIWNNRDEYLGKIAKFKYQDIGVKDAPRCPIWLGFRDPEDM